MAGAGSLLLLLPQGASAQETTADRAAIVHVLNRITFGPRQGDVEMVQKMGLHNYIESQLHPDSIDDSAVEQEVSQFELLQMSAQQLARLYINEVKLAKEIKQQVTNDAKKNEAATASAPPAAPMQSQAAPAPSDTMQGQAAPDTTMQNQAAPETKREQKTQDPAAMALLQKLKDADIWRSVATVGQLDQAKLLRAIESKRQLQEVLVDFWSNHFNIDVKKKPDDILKVTDDRDVIRPHILGKFRDLLEASAKSPAMLQYLDNDKSSVSRDVGPMEQMMQERVQAKLAGEPPPTTMPTQSKKAGGINENYGRELMELHTIGVNAGYTQKDVQEVARCFTGWSIDRETGAFHFRPHMHDNGEKTVLGHDIPANGGIQDGERVLDILVAQPACAQFISRELCQRFVSDNPPAALVDRIAAVFTQTGGDLRAVTEAILTSPEFMSPVNYGNKIKSPLEFAVSAIRASGATLIAQPPESNRKRYFARESTALLGRGQAGDRMGQLKQQPLAWHLLEMGQPLFQCTPPTGYSEVSTTWVSPGALIERLNFALALTQQQMSDVRFDPKNVLGGVDLDNPDAVLAQSVATLLPDNISDSTRAVLKKDTLPDPTESKTVNPSKLIALLIGSPEFQRK